MWSAGVTWLELVLATPHVFAPSARTRARLFHQLRLGEQSQARAPGAPVGAGWGYIWAHMRAGCSARCAIG